MIKLTDQQWSDLAGYVGGVFLVAIIVLILYAGSHTGADPGALSGW